MNTVLRFRNGLVTGLFFLVLALPALNFTFNFDRAPQPNDNRTLHPWPSLPADLAELRTYPAKAEGYFNDHFSFRNRLVRWYGRWKKSLFKDLSGVEVTRGKDGWLFYSCCHMVDHLRGARPFDAATLEALRAEFDKRWRWLKQRNKAYLLVIPPNKESIYPEYLPDWLQAGLPAVSKLDQFLDHMRRNSDVPVLDLRPALMEAKARAPVYFKDDSHWNDYGSYIAALSIRHALRGSATEPVPAIAAQRMGIGDLAGMLGETSATDTAAYIPSPDSGIAALMLKPDPAIAPGEWPGTTGPFSTEDVQASDRLLVLHDSFGDQLAAYLGTGIRRAAYVRQYVWFRNNGNFGWLPDIVARENPDAVIDEIVERGLLNLTTDKIVPWNP